MAPSLRSTCKQKLNLSAEVYAQFVQVKLLWCADEDENKFVDWLLQIAIHFLRPQKIVCCSTQTEGGTTVSISSQTCSTLEKATHITTPNDFYLTGDEMVEANKNCTSTLDPVKSNIRNESAVMLSDLMDVVGSPFPLENDDVSNESLGQEFDSIDTDMEGNHDLEFISSLPIQPIGTEFCCDILTAKAETNETSNKTQNQNIERAQEIGNNIKLQQGSELPDINKPFKCFHCGMKLSTLATLKRHKTTHRARKCDLCNKVLANSKTLRKHFLNVHEKAKLHKCPHCDYSTPYTQYLKVHIQRHTSAARFKCKICDKGFPAMSELSGHFRRTHSSERSAVAAVCEHCGRQFARRDTLREHIRAVHSVCGTSGDNFSCPTCHRTFVNKQGLSLHIKHVHSSQFDQSTASTK